MSYKCIQGNLFCFSSPMNLYVLPLVKTHKTFIKNKYKEIIV